MSWTAATVLPIGVIALLAGFLPFVLGPRLPRTLTGLALTFAASAAILTLVSAGLFLALYLFEGLPVGALGAEAGTAAGYFATLGLKPALVWLPVLLLSCLGCGQRMEAEKGRALAARDPE